MVEKDQFKITEQEAELYDRQIRLWGLDAQKRLRASRVLVVGMKGLGCEVSKNLVLSGVRSLKMLDHEVVTVEDATSQFLAPRDKVGSNRAEASMDRLQQLNPMVEVSADVANVKDKKEDFFQQFDIVICTTCPKDELVRINSLCRKDNIMFFGGGVYGFYGYTFMDLVQHEYVEEVTSTAPPPKENEEQQENGDGEPTAKKAKAAAEEETKTVKKAMTFVSLAETLKVDWSSELYAKRIKRMDPSFFLLQVMYAFEAETGCAPRPSERAQDLETLKKLRDSTLKTMGVPCEKIKDEMLELLFAELSPVAAIVGGMLGQEVIKAISNKDAPHNNYFFYNPLDSCGVVETIGY